MRYLLWIPVLFLMGCAARFPNVAHPELPIVQREFRAAWIASVANINWPSEPGLSTQEQKKEAIELLDLLEKLNFNAAILQVRPQADALYPSEWEPWSYYLTGEQGRRPYPMYDPLKFWIKEAHRRGLELHAWLNPYRAHHIRGGEVTEHSIVKKRPELVVQLANGYWWMDPALQGTQDHSYAVVMDIVDRYDVDGIHFDDYFYPYPSYHEGKEFPDSTSWRAYQAQGGKLTRDDWRRKSVNDFIKRLYKGIKKEKPQVKFGLSPFGIWRPDNPASIQGFDQYEKLYADAKLWLNKGWIDYFAPQLYWPINQTPQSYPVLLGWWEGENKKGRHLWPGMSIGRLSGEKAIDETLNQIMVTRGMLPESPGNIHWSIGPLVDRPELASAILKGPYATPALVPTARWLDRKPPQRPQNVSATPSIGLKRHIGIQGADSLLAPIKTIPTKTINWSLDRDVYNWVIYSRYGNSWTHDILSGYRFDYTLPLIDPNGSKLEKLAISAVDRMGNESPPVYLNVTGDELQLRKEFLRKE